MRRLNALAATALAATLLVAGSAAHARPDSTAPYGDKVTGAIADKLDGKHRDGWMATILDYGRYTGPRHAEIMKTSTGHGKRWVGVIHVPAKRVKAARNAFVGQWYAEHGRAFVMPLTSEVDNFGGHTPDYKACAQWAAKTLGKKWKVRIS